MNSDNDKLKIKDLGDFELNPPYEIMIDINPDENYWASGMITKYKGKDVMIIQSTSRKEWKKVLSDDDAGIQMQDRIIFKLLITDL